MTVKSRNEFIVHDHTIPADLQSAEDEKMQDGAGALVAEN